MPDEAKPKAAKPTPLGDAAASTNPLVHKALADLEIAERNDDADGVKAGKDALHELGVTL